MKHKQKLLSLIILLAATSTGFQSICQIPPGYYDPATGVYGAQLKNALNNIIDNHVEFSYDDVKDILQETDEDPQNFNNVILLYTGRSQAKSTFGGGANDWNREHVWAKSHGDFGNNPPCGTDVHHMKPTDASVNSDRGNKDFDNGGQQHPEATGCYYTQYTWEPRDEVKGDVARMILYMDVRYEGNSGEPDLTAVDAVNTSPAPEHGRLSTLLAWHASDPPDAFEINRNNVIYSYQQNRNPFIDHPEFAGYIWNPPSGTGNAADLASGISLFPVPANSMVTISGLAQNQDINTVVLHDMNGAVQYIPSTESDGQYKMDVSGLPEGGYVCRIVSDGVIIHRKVIICR
ncbi:MAG: endonuclease [Bacteroidales bacterium]|nr:endonuclease [Bacteroidales bacterium]